MASSSPGHLWVLPEAAPSNLKARGGHVLCVAWGQSQPAPMLIRMAERGPQTTWHKGHLPSAEGSCRVRQRVGLRLPPRPGTCLVHERSRVLAALRQSKPGGQPPAVLWDAAATPEPARPSCPLLAKRRPGHREGQCQHQAEFLHGSQLRGQKEPLLQSLRFSFHWKE